jgi:hypothetical protein
MTIAVIWQEDGVQWCAADTRLVAGDTPSTELAAKIYAIPVAASAVDEDGELRMPHGFAQYGFVYAGSVLTASTTAITSSTLLQRLSREGQRTDLPKFEHIAEFVYRLSDHFMQERVYFMRNRIHRGADAMFSAALFGWCPQTNSYKVAYINGREDLTVELSYLSCTRFRRHQVRCFMEQEVRHGEKAVYAGVQA